MAQSERETVLQALAAFIEQRPGFELGNYGAYSARNVREMQDVRRAYMQDYRVTWRHLHHARRLLNAVAWRESLYADALKRAMQRAFSGRLEWDETRGQLHYTPGQYAPMEYRAAVCAVLSAALWEYWRESGCDTVDKIRRKAKAELGRSCAEQWFD